MGIEDVIRYLKHLGKEFDPEYEGINIILLK